MPAFYSRTGLSRLRRRRNPRVHGLSSTDFEGAYLRERSRANRSLRPLSVVTFGLVDGSKRDLAEATRIACEHVRCSDDVGRLDRRTVAVLLPETDGDQDWILADRLRTLLTRAGISADPDVLALPDRVRVGATSAARRDDDEDQNPPRDPGGPEERRVLEPVEPWANEPAAVERESDERVASAVDSLASVARSAARPVGDLWAESCKPLSIWRRAVDIAVSGAGLIALAPLLAIVAIAVKLTTSGPAIFVQKRAGVGGRPFSFFKFRSMYHGAERQRAALASANEQGGPIFKIKNDPRLTPIGRLLRKTSIDELPQLYNVLVGDMTLIGPRPPTLDEVAAYEPWQRDRLSVPGGLTCIWQVSGRSDIGFDEWVRMDLRYALTRSPLVDLSLVSRTFKAVATGRGAY